MSSFSKKQRDAILQRALRGNGLGKISMPIPLDLIKTFYKAFNKTKCVRHAVHMAKMFNLELIVLKIRFIKRNQTAVRGSHLPSELSPPSLQQQGQKPATHKRKQERPTQIRHILRFKR